MLNSSSSLIWDFTSDIMWQPNTLPKWHVVQNMNNINQSAHWKCVPLWTSLQKCAVHKMYCSVLKLPLEAVKHQQLIQLITEADYWLITTYFHAVPCTILLWPTQYHLAKIYPQVKKKFDFSSPLCHIWVKRLLEWGIQLMKKMPWFHPSGKIGS